MKLNLLAVFTSLTLFAAQSFGQISITQADSWVIGDSIPRALDTLTTFQPGPDGPNQSWNFSGAIPRVYQTTKVMTPAATPYASSFTTSNQAMTTNDSLYLYFNTTASSVVAKGTAGKIVFTPPTVTDFNFSFNPDLLTNSFPINYGNNFTDTYGYDAVVDGAAFSVKKARLKHFGTVYDTIVGWGTITTNAGTYECLKQKIVEYTIDSAWTKILFDFEPWTLVSAKKDTVTSYSWLTKETKLPVAELTFDSLGNPKQLVWSLIPPSVNTGISNTPEHQLSIFPNPASEQLRIVPSGELNGSPMSIRIFNLFGQEVYQTSAGSSVNGITIDVSKFKAGEYFMDAYSENESRRYHRIFSVAR